MSVISVQNVSKEYRVHQQKSGAGGALKSFFRPEKKYVQAIKNLSFEIKQGDFIGFIGENGAGKSTMIKMMSGILFPSSGEILTNGIVPYKKRKQNALQIGVVFGQRSRLVWELPMVDTFLLYKEMYRIDKDKYDKNVKLFVEMLEMGGYVDTPVRQLSLGQRMRAEIALAMLHSPPILFLDEPTIGLDVVAKKHIRDFFRERNERDGTTIILTSHDMKDLDTISKRIIMIAKGTMLFDGTLSELREKFSEENVAEFSFASEIDKLSAERFGALTNAGHKLTVAYNPAERTLPELIASVSSLGELSNIEVKSADIEDIVRKVYQ